MLTFQGQRRSFCDGIARRDFLTLGALGAGLTLADALRLQAAQPAKKSVQEQFLNVILKVRLLRWLSPSNSVF